MFVARYGVGRALSAGHPPLGRDRRVRRSGRPSRTGRSRIRGRRHGRSAPSCTRRPGRVTANAPTTRRCPRSARRWSRRCRRLTRAWRAGSSCGRTRSTGTRDRPHCADIRDAIFAAGAERGGDKAADFAAADVIVSDISGVTAEFLFTEKPALMPRHRAARSRGQGRRRGWPRSTLGLSLAGRTGASLVERLDRLVASTPARSRSRPGRATCSAATELEEAVASFDLALESVVWRRTRVPVRWVYEAKRSRPALSLLRAARPSGGAGDAGAATGRRSRSPPMSTPSTSDTTITALNR